MESFESWLRSEGLAATTARMYSYLLKRLQACAGPLGELTTDDLCRGLVLLYKDRNAEQGKSLSLIALRKCYQYSNRIRITYHDATSGLRVRRHRSRNLPLATLLGLNDMENRDNRIERYSCYTLRNKIILSFLRENALTSQEICAIGHRDIDLPKAILKVRPSLKLNGRKLMLSGAQVYLISEYLRDHPSGGVPDEFDWFFSAPSGKVILPGLVRYIVEQLKARLPSKDINPMRIRQSVIYHWLNTSKIPLERVQVMAGHRDICSTLRYMSPYTNEELAAVNAYHPMSSWGVHPLFG